MSELLVTSSAFAGVFIPHVSAAMRAAVQNILFLFGRIPPKPVSRCSCIARSSKHFVPRCRIASPRLDVATKRQPQLAYERLRGGDTA
jgi:hypothetical protein